MGTWIGEHRFNRCQSKAIKYRNYYRSHDEIGNVTHSEPPKKGTYDIRMAAELLCPKTRSQKVALQSPSCVDRADAFENIKQLAAKTMCISCKLSGKSPVQLEAMEAERLSAEANRIEAQNKVDLATKRSEYIQKLGEEELAHLNEDLILEFPKTIEPTTR